MSVRNPPMAALEERAASWWRAGGVEAAGPEEVAVDGAGAAVADEDWQ